MMHMNDLTETMISREDKFVGRIVGVHVDQVRLPNGNTAPREVVDHGGGVSVLALDENNIPVQVPKLILQTDEERLAWAHGEERRRIRIQRKKDKLDGI